MLPPKKLRNNQEPVSGMRRKIMSVRSLTEVGRVVSCEALDLAEILQDRIDELESVIDLITDLGTGEDDLAADEDQEHNLWFDHTVNQTGEQLRFVGTEVVVARSQTLETDRELDIAGADNVLNLEVGELGVEAELLDDTSVLARSKLGVILRLGTRDNHLAGSKDQSGGLGLTNSHDDSGETLRVCSM